MDALDSEVAVDIEVDSEMDEKTFGATPTDDAWLSTPDEASGLFMPHITAEN
jgi:hypothetical protein